jgi:hypothetical protein
MRTTDRMQDSTATDVQARIAEQTRTELATAVASGTFGERLAALEGEWDAERVLFTATGINVLLGLLLGWRVDPRWYGWVAGVAAFQFQHGVQGWCPPLAVIRRLGVRTRREIDEERTALKALRGDFRDLNDLSDVNDALHAVRR